jgi:serine/threonine-protein kinase HipA
MATGRGSAAKPKQLEVVLEGHHAGQLRQDFHGRLSFAYDDDYRRLGEATALSLSMPVSRAEHPHNIVDPFLRGLLPDSDAVLARWGRTFGVSANSPFALLSHVGEDVAGAAQFVLPERLDEATAPGAIEMVDDDYLSRRLRTLRGDRSAWDDAHAPVRFSLAGQQPKFALYRSRTGQWGLPSGRQATTHILKPALPNLADQDVNEHLCLVAARLLGLRAAVSSIEVFGDERAIVLVRYDRRVDSNGLVVRVHQEDFCQAMAIPPDRKYEREDGGPGIAAMVELLRGVQPYTEAIASAQHYVKALAYNWLIYGPDAHAKNYSLLLSGAEVAPSPLYDISSVLPYPNAYDLRHMAMAMSVNGKYQNNLIHRDDWTSLALKLGLGPEEVLSWVRDMAERVSDAFVTAARANQELIGNLAVVPALVDNVAIYARELARYL